MRPLIVALLIAGAASASAQTPFSVDFYYSQFDVGQGGWVTPYLRLSGTLPGATTVPLTWSYSFGSGPPVSGTIDITSKTRDAFFNIEGPITSSYIGTMPGTASISYQAPGEQPVTKSIPLTLVDHSEGVDMEDDRVLENDPSPHAIPFRLHKPSNFPLTVKFTPQYYGTASPSDYTLLDTSISLPAGVMSGEMHYSITSDATAEGDETFYIRAVVYDGAKEIGYGFADVTITERQIRAMFIPDQLNVFAGDPFSLLVVLSEPLVLPRYSPRTTMSFGTSNPAVVSTLPAPLMVGDSTTVGTMTANAGSAGDAVVTAEDANAGSVIAAAAHVHVYDGTFTFGEIKTLVIAPDQKIAVPVQMTPAPPEPIDLYVAEERLAGFVEVESNLQIDTSGKGVFTVKGKKVGTTIIGIESPGRRRVSGLQVVVQTPPPPPPSRSRSVRH